MRKAGNAFFKTLRYLCLIGVIALGLITVIGSNGDGGGGESTPTVSDTDTTTSEEWRIEGICIPEQGEYLKFVDADVVALPTGGYRIYFEACHIDNPDAPGSIISATSSDGLNWEIESGVRLADSGAPSLIQLEDGRWRMYYGIGHQGIKSAVSNDGVNFEEEEGIRIAWGGIYDSLDASCPSVIKLSDGTYRMYYHGAVENPYDPEGFWDRILSAISSDGLTWEKEEGVRIDGTTEPYFVEEDPSGWTISSPAAVKLADDSIKIYFKSNRKNPGIHRAYSEDGLNFTLDTVPLISVEDMYDSLGDQGGDPTLIKLPDGRYRMYFQLVPSSGLGIASAVSQVME